MYCSSALINGYSLRNTQYGGQLLRLQPLKSLENLFCGAIPVATPLANSPKLCYLRAAFAGGDLMAGQDGSGSPKYPERQARYEAGSGQMPRGYEGKCRLLTLDGLDARTAAYRETRRLIDEFESDLGGAEHLSAAERQMVQHGAVLGAIAADLEAQYLKGRRIDLVSLCTV